MTSPEPTAGGEAQAVDWLRQLGPLAARRPPASLGGCVAGVGGALVAAGVVVVAGDRWASTGSSGLAVVVTAALLVASVVALVAAPAPVRVAAVSASGLAAPAAAFFLNAGGGFPSIRGTAFVAAALLAGLYAVGPWRGHTFHLAILVVAGWLFALSLNDVGIGGTFSGGLGTLGDVVTGAGVASILTGSLYLAAGWWLDDQGLEGMATPFLAVGAVALPLGTVAVVRDGGDLVGGAAALAAGAAVALVGGWCRRRGTTWIGAAVAAAGVLAVTDGLAPGGVVTSALLVAVAGVGLVVLAPLAGATVKEPDLGEAAADAEPPVAPRPGVDVP